MMPGFGGAFEAGRCTTECRRELPETPMCWRVLKAYLHIFPSHFLGVQPSMSLYSLNELGQLQFLSRKLQAKQLLEYFFCQA